MVIYRTIPHKPVIHSFVIYRTVPHMPVIHSFVFKEQYHICRLFIRLFSKNNTNYAGYSFVCFQRTIPHKLVIHLFVFRCNTADKVYYHTTKLDCAYLSSFPCGQTQLQLSIPVWTPALLRSAIEKQVRPSLSLTYLN
jgi:hypothetical protein